MKTKAVISVTGLTLVKLGSGNPVSFAVGQSGFSFGAGWLTLLGLVLYVEGEFFYCVEGNAKYHDYTVPNDPEVDSYHVMTNKRLISAHYFGVPD